MKAPRHDAMSRRQFQDLISLIRCISSANQWLVCLGGVACACLGVAVTSGQTMLSPFNQREVQVGVLAVYIGAVAAVWPMRVSLPITPKHRSRVRFLHVANAALFIAGTTAVAATGFATRPADLDTVATVWDTAYLTAALTAPTAMWRPHLTWLPGFAVVGASIFAPTGFLSVLEMVLMHTPTPALWMVIAIVTIIYVTTGGRAEDKL